MAGATTYDSQITTVHMGQMSQFRPSGPVIVFTFTWVNCHTLSAINTHAHMSKTNTTAGAEIPTIEAEIMPTATTLTSEQRVNFTRGIHFRMADDGGGGRHLQHQSQWPGAANDFATNYWVMRSK